MLTSSSPPSSSSSPSSSSRTKRKTSDENAGITVTTITTNGEKNSRKSTKRLKTAKPTTKQQESVDISTFYTFLNIANYNPELTKSLWPIVISVSRSSHSLARNWRALAHLITLKSIHDTPSTIIKSFRPVRVTINCTILQAQKAFKKLEVPLVSLALENIPLSNAEKKELRYHNTMQRWTLASATAACGNNLALFSSLKKLSVMSLSLDDVDAFSSKSLEELNIYSYSSTMTVSILNAFLSKCPRLQKLYVNTVFSSSEDDYTLVTPPLLKSIMLSSTVVDFGTNTHLKFAESCAVEVMDVWTGVPLHFPPLLHTVVFHHYVSLDVPLPSSIHTLRWKNGNTRCVHPHVRHLTSRSSTPIEYGRHFPGLRSLTVHCMELKNNLNMDNLFPSTLEHIDIDVRGESECHIATGRFPEMPRLESVCLSGSLANWWVYSQHSKDAKFPALRSIKLWALLFEPKGRINISEQDACIEALLPPNLEKLWIGNTQSSMHELEDPRRRFWDLAKKAHKPYPALKSLTLPRLNTVRDTILLVGSFANSVDNLLLYQNVSGCHSKMDKEPLYAVGCRTVDQIGYCH